MFRLRWNTALVAVLEEGSGGASRKGIDIVMSGA